MQNTTFLYLFKAGPLIIFCMILFSACDRASSPEGRMSIKIENLQKEMMDSLKQQNEVILDSLGSIRKDLDALRQQMK